jgi:hypothetical protein
LYHIIDGSKKYVSIQLTIARPSNVGFEGPAAAPIARLKDANLGLVGMSIRSIDPFHIVVSNVDFHAHVTVSQSFSQLITRVANAKTLAMSGS